MPRPRDPDEWMRREASRPSEDAARAMNALFRGRPALSGDGDEEEEEDGDVLSPAARVAAGGGFDGGARGERPIERQDSSASINALLRGAMAEKRDRLILRGGGDMSVSRGPNGVGS
jgi:hypothetical protein